MAHHHRNEEISIDALIEEQRRRAGSKNPLERIVGALSLAGALKKELASLPDKSIGQLMFDHVWNELNLLSPEMTICQVATERLIDSSVVKTTKENLDR